MFPFERHILRAPLLEELQNPLAVTADEIMKDLLKFVKDFPVEVIPHMNEQEIQAYMKIKSLSQFQKESMKSPLKKGLNVGSS